MDLTHARMWHKDRATTDKYYADKNAPQELADLFNRWAKKLYGDEAFENSLLHEGYYCDKNEKKWL